MEAEKEKDPLLSTIESCRPTSSQEAILTTCPLLRLEIIEPYWVELSSPSSEVASSHPAGTAMVTPAASSHHQAEEDDMVFHTPPEHHHNSHLSSSEDELCAERVRVPKKVGVRVSEGELNDDAESEQIRVPTEGFDGEKFLNVFEVVCDGDKDVDFLATAKSRGLTFPPPRWWPPPEGGAQ
ncbi:hypothetical protein ABFS83_08G128300 [Erythranthe nasuta]